MNRKLRRALWLLPALAVLLAVGYYFALHTLKQQVIQALGPNGVVQSLELKGLAVEITGLRIRADAQGKGSWPVADELRAARVFVEPDLRSLFSDTIIVRTLRIEQVYLPMLRASTGMQIVPSLLAQKKQAAKPDPAKASGKTILIKRIELLEGRIDFFDATISRKPHLIAIDKVMARIDDLKLPAMDEAMTLDFAGTLPGVRKDKPGGVMLKGPLSVANRDANLKLALEGVSLLALQPYFIKAANTQVRSGVMDLHIEASVKKSLLHAPGTLLLENLSVSGDDFAGLSRRAALALLQDKRERIDMQFSIDGRLDDPKFSLNEQFYIKVGNALAEALGVSLESLGAGSVKIPSEVGDALKKLFSK